MSTETVSTFPPTEASNPLRARVNLFLVSLLILFLELACIRWFPAHVLFLTFFTNVVLLACFLGMSVGCLAAGHRRNYLTWTPVLLAASIGMAFFMELMHTQVEQRLDVGGQGNRPQLVFFGTEYHSYDPNVFRIPMEVLGGLFFLLIALTMIGPGQELGRCLNRIPNRVAAYTINILGSVVGIVLFSAFSWLQLSPVWWFLPVALGLAYFLLPRQTFGLAYANWAIRVAFLVVILAGLAYHTGTHARVDQDWNPTGEYRTYLWSPYYRIDYYEPPERLINVNLIGHQKMRTEGYVSPEYALPHLLHRDIQRAHKQDPKPFEDLLIIGAGSGNDVSRALQWGVKHIDAVEIDPVILGLGKRDHPMQPYSDEYKDRVSVHLDDGRNFLRSSDKKYDLIVYALVDSLVLHSSYSNIRLESYLFTKQAFEDIKRHLKPGGMFVTYNYFRQGFIVSRLSKGLEEVFGEGNPVVLAFPYRGVVNPDKPFGGFTVVFAGDTQPMKEAFTAESGQPRDYFLKEEAPTLQTPNGFEEPGAEVRRQWNALDWDEQEKQEVRWWRFGPADVHQPAQPLLTASDNWPFLYLRDPMIPLRPSLSGMLVMALLALLLLFLFAPRGDGIGRWSFDGRMFFLGAGFMLVETKAVVHMALLFGSTWIVNSVVFFAVLIMILLANLFVLRVKPQQLWPYYLGLIATLLLNVVVPLDFFLGWSRSVQVLASCLLVFAPILFAGVIFAVSFSRTRDADRAFGANIAGAMLGGLAENASMLLGFQYLLLVAVAFYLLSAWLVQRRAPLPEGKTG